MPSPGGKQADRPTSPRIRPQPQVSPPPEETAYRIELSSASFLLDPALVIRTMPLVVAPTVATGYVRIKLSYVALGIADIYRHTIPRLNLNRGDLFPLSSGFIATGKFVAAGTSTDLWNQVSVDTCVIVFRVRATKFESVIDVPYRHVFLCPEDSKEQCMVAASFTGSLVLKAITRGIENPVTTGDISVLVLNADSGTSMMIALKIQQNGYNVRVCINNTVAIPLYGRFTAGINVFNMSAIDTWINERRKFTYVVTSTDWSTFGNIPTALKLCKRFESTLVVYGPSSHLPRFSKMQVSKFADSMVPITWVSIQSDDLSQEEVSQYVRESILHVNAHKSAAQVMINPTRYTGVSSIGQYVRGMVDDLPMGLKVLELR